MNTEKTKAIYEDASFPLQIQMVTMFIEGFMKATDRYTESEVMEAVWLLPFQVSHTVIAHVVLDYGFKFALVGEKEKTSKVAKGI